MVQYPVLEVLIGGAVVERRPVSFSLFTSRGQPQVLAKLSYPEDATEGNADDPIVINLVSGEEKNLYFTGVIYDAHVHGARRELLLTDDYKKLVDSVFTPAYRKEKAKAILEDVLSAAGIANKKITCPEVELARFSTDTITVKNCVDLLIDALTAHGYHDLYYFFDAENVFRFGTIEDSAKNESGEVYKLETGKNIIHKGESWIETLPLPLRHSRDITVDGAALKTFRTELFVAQTKSRIKFWVRGE